jgi:hypothetical protein
MFCLTTERPLTDMGSIPIDYIETLRSENKKRANYAKARFDNCVRRANLSSESSVIDTEISEAPTIFSCIARCFDLAIVGQADQNKNVSDKMIIEAALLNSRRPLVVVPYIQKAAFTLNRVMVCWDGGHNAA